MLNVRRQTQSVSYLYGSPGDSVVKNPPDSTGDTGSIPGSGRSPQATQCSILAWKITWTEEPSRLESVVLQRVGHK